MKPAPATPPPPLSAVEAAEVLGMSKSWVYENAGPLGASKFGNKIKFPLDRLLAYIEAQRIEQPPEPAVQPPPTDIATRRAPLRGKGPNNPISGLPWESAR